MTEWLEELTSGWSGPDVPWGVDREDKVICALFDESGGSGMQTGQVEKVGWLPPKTGVSVDEWDAASLANCSSSDGGPAELIILDSGEWIKE